MSHDDSHDHEGPCISVVPTRAFEIVAGDMLAAPGKGAPRICLVTFAERMTDDSTDTDRVTLNILDAMIWEANEGEMTEAKLELDAMNILGRVVKDEH